jgi:Uroporphyrinogen decarboxylase (URO-D)
MRTEDMNNRTRFIETILFGNPDKIPFMPGDPRESTLKAWKEQGFREGVHYFDQLADIFSIDLHLPEESYDIGVSFRMIPMFEEKVLEHKEGHYIVQDWMGAITEISDEYDLSYLREARDFVTRKWHKFPVENRADWAEMKSRFSTVTEGRFSKDFEERAAKSHDSTEIVELEVAGPFWQLREWLGFENLCMKFIEYPDFIKDMIEFWQEFVSQIMSKVLDKARVDKILITEDMAYKTRSMISPKMVREFIQPTYLSWIKEFTAKGVEVIDIDSDGYIGELIPIWIEAGYNCCEPIEIAAGCDPVEFREQFGNKMAYIGGIDKRLIAKGGQELETELRRIIPALLKDGGYIPGCDHGVPPDISWPNFVEYSRLLAQLTGWL